MLKRIIENTEGLHEAVMSLYEKKADGKFHLIVEDDDGAELRRAKDHEVGLRKIAERDLAAARTELETSTAKVAELTRTQQTGVAELRAELELEHTQQISKLNVENAKKVESLEKSVKKVFVHDVAAGIAKDIAVDAGAAELLVDVIQRRLSVEIVDGEPVTRVLAADGKASAMTPDQLKNEYFTNEKYARIMRASDASGGGASGGGKGGGASKPFGDLNESERREFYKRDPVEFDRQLAIESAAA